MTADDLATIIAGIAPLLRDMHTRVAALETRALVPGPPGPPGRDGVPGLEYRGVFVDGASYAAGDLVTWAGSAWHCNDATTTKPGDGAKAWTLMVKRGRDGKDGTHGPAGPEGPKGKDWQQVYDDTRRR
jgi:hypothetical protein